MCEITPAEMIQVADRIVVFMELIIVFFVGYHVAGIVENRNKRQIKKKGLDG